MLKKLQLWYNYNTPGQRLFLWIVSVLLIFAFGIGLIPLILFIYLELGRRANKYLDER